MDVPASDGRPSFAACIEPARHQRIGVPAELFPRPAGDHGAGLDDVDVVRDVQGGADVLIHQQDRLVEFVREPDAQLGYLAFGLYLLVIVGTSNAVNLTDGLDGLAAGCSTTVAATYGMLAYVAATAPAANYLQIPNVPAAGELTVLCMALAGACLGFLCKSGC